MSTPAPATRPTSNILWASAATRTEPAPGDRSAGWTAPTTTHAAAEFNWLLYETAYHIEWISTLIEDLDALLIEGWA